MIPDQDGERANKIHEQGQPRARPAQLFARGRPEHEHRQPAQQLEQRGVLAQETESHPQPDPQPIGRGGLVLDGPPAGHHGQRPEHDGQRVHGHEHREPTASSGTVGKMTESQKAARTFATQRHETQQQQADDGGDDRGKEADAEDVVAPERGAEKLGDGNQQRLAVIRKRQVLGPDPLIRFIAAQPDFPAGVVSQVREQFEHDERVTKPHPMLLPQRVVCGLGCRLSRHGRSSRNPGIQNRRQAFPPNWKPAAAGPLPACFERPSGGGGAAQTNNGPRQNVAGIMDAVVDSGEADN